MPRYLIQQPSTPKGLFGTIDASERHLPFAVGEVHEMPVRDATESWVVAAIKPSPREGYEALIVFEMAAPDPGSSSGDTRCDDGSKIDLS
jgi:hypothetical protein